MPYILLDPSLAAAAPASTAGAPLISVGATLASLQSDLVEELATRGDIDPTKTAKWINKAYQYLASILVIKELFAEVSLNLVSGQAMYLIPPNVVYVDSISLPDFTTYPTEGGVKLDPIDLDTYRKLPENQPGASSTVDYPTAYFRERGMIVVYRTPLTSYTARMRFKYRPADLVNPSDSPVLPIEFHDALLLRAKHQALRTLKSFTEAGIARNDFVSDVRSIVDSDAQEQPVGSIRPIRSSRDFNRLR